MVRNIQEINKNDVIKIGERTYTVLDRMDLYIYSMDSENNLQKMEVRLVEKDEPENEAIIINTKEGFFLLNRVRLKQSLLKKLRFRFMGEEYLLRERLEIVRSEKEAQFFHKSRIYKSRTGIVVAEKLEDKISVYHGQSISRDDIFVVEKGTGVFIPKRSYFNILEIEKTTVSPLLAGILSILFLFFGLLYVSPWVAMIGFILIMIPPIIFGVEAFAFAPLISLLVSQVAADIKNRKYYRF
jgi:hypothetical protein